MISLEKNGKKIRMGIIIILKRRNFFNRDNKIGSGRGEKKKLGEKFF